MIPVYRLHNLLYTRAVSPILLLCLRFFKHILQALLPGKLRSKRLSSRSRNDSGTIRIINRVSRRLFFSCVQPADSPCSLPVRYRIDSRCLYSDLCVVVFLLGPGSSAGSGHLLAGATGRVRRHPCHAEVSPYRFDALRIPCQLDQALLCGHLSGTCPESVTFP